MLKNICCCLILIAMASHAPAQFRLRGGCVRQWRPAPQWHYLPPIDLRLEIPDAPPIDDAPPPAKKVVEPKIIPVPDRALENRAKIEIRTPPEAELFCYDATGDKWLSMGLKLRAFTTPELKQNIMYTYKFKMVTPGPQSIERIVTVRFQAGDEVVSALDEPLPAEKKQ